jgi:hypothetical protein
VEMIKRDPAEFGGIQSQPLSGVEITQRFCCVKFCANPGKLQFRIPSNGSSVFYRIVCAPHLVQLHLLIGVMFGDPGAVTEAREVARLLEVEQLPAVMRDLLPGAELETGMGLFNPRYGRCARCGGGWVVEKQGMFSGERYVHICGVPGRPGRKEGS